MFTGKYGVFQLLVSRIINIFSFCKNFKKKTWTIDVFFCKQAKATVPYTKICLMFAVSLVFLQKRDLLISDRKHCMYRTSHKNMLLRATAPNSTFLSSKSFRRQPHVMVGNCPTPAVQNFGFLCDASCDPSGSRLLWRNATAPNHYRLHFQKQFKTAQSTTFLEEPTSA